MSWYSSRKIRGTCTKKYKTRRLDTGVFRDQDKLHRAAIIKKNNTKETFENPTDALAKKVRIVWSLHQSGLYMEYISCA